MRRFAPPVPRGWSLVFCLTLLMAWGGTPSAQQFPGPIADPNVNMVRGITFPDGDPYLQRQNEPSIAISTRNPCHLVAGANDYRSVDIPFDDTVPPNSQPSASLAGDAWLGLFKSFDCGQKWQSTLLPGYPQDDSGLAPELEGYEAGADPTVRAGTNGLFYYSGMVFNRGAQGDSKIFVARLVDNNNKERGDPIQFVDVATIDTGTKGQFLDKPWLAVDVPRNSYGPGSTLATGGSSSAGACEVNGQQVPASNVYMVWAKFTGDANDHSKLMFAKSSDCGKTWKTRPVSNNQSISQGGNIAIAPHDGTVYLTWREFAHDAKPIRVWSAVSSDGGESFSNPRVVAGNVVMFDQLRSETTFRTNALPAITADHQNRVYLAWSARGAAMTDVDGVLTPTSDARIMMSVSSDLGRTFSPAFPIDPNLKRGHQVMPSLAFAAGKIQAIWYDAREDVSGVFRNYIDDKDTQPETPRHTIDVRGAQAGPASVPVFVAANGESLEISKYRQWSWEVKNPDGTVTRQSAEIGSNPPNLPMYAQGTTPFVGDYIDVSGLSAFPIQASGGQVWQPNIGPVNLTGATASNISSGGYPTLPIFHAAWTDNRDVRIAAQCIADPETGVLVPQEVGQRNANIYTARLTPGLFVGSPGNTKPLGFRTDPVTKTDELIQRGFVVFAQNTTDTLKFFQFAIANQPAGGKASFRQFEKAGVPPRDLVTVSIPRRSTVARTVYATSSDPVAQILVNIHEVVPGPPLPPTGNGASPSNSTPGNGTPTWVPVEGGLKGSILLNPDRTNPKILDPDLDEFDPLVPQIATDEIHDPAMFEAQFFRHKPGTVSRQLDVKNPDPENPDPENPDPENPDPENPDPENPDPGNPDPENPDPENPDPENPDPENPDPENPDPENPDVENKSISDGELATAAITDINWRVHNNGNTTSAYGFRPSLPRKLDNQKYQLIVTRRYMVLTMDPATCKPVYKSQNQVLVNIENFKPRTPDPENSDPENPDPENPDPENPDPENPDPENPDPENANFFLAPDETATVTLRVFDLEPADNEPAPTTENDVAGKTAAQAANTGETTVSTAVAGPDLTLSDVPPAVTPAVIRPGATVNVTWTLTNRGTASAIVPPPDTAIKTNVYFSADAILDPADVKIGATIEEPSPFPHCAGAVADATCSTTTTTIVNLAALAAQYPQFQGPGQYHLIVVTDDDNDADDPVEGADPDRLVFEADELNNVLVVPLTVDPFQLTFAAQPSATTQDFTMTPPVVVAITHPDGQAVGLGDVPAVTLAIQNNPAPGGILSGTTVQPNAGGVATFADLKIDRAANGYTLAATAPFSTGAISTAFNIEADLPPVVGNDSYTTAEDQTFNVPAPGVLTNDSDPPTLGIKPAAYNFDAVVATSPANGVLALNLDGSFSYTPNATFAGTDTFTYKARDGRPGNETTGTMTITVTPINDAPSFTRGADQTVAEDAGPQTVAGWATEISPGPANESGQTVNFEVTLNSNAALFSAQPAVSSNGTLTFTTAPNANGTATIDIIARDNGGTAGGGDDTSAPQTFTITVNAVNDPPAFTKGADQTVAEDSGAQSVPNWATAISAGPADESGQSLTFIVLNPGNPGLFSVQPAISADGTLTYTPAPDANGTANVLVQLQDNGGGMNLSASTSFNITVSAVNDTPSFTKGADQSVVEDSGAQTVAEWATATSAGPANEAGQVVDFLVTNDNNPLFSSQPAVSPNGTLSYRPAINANGVATVTVRIHDNGGGADTSAPQAFTITVTGDNDAPAAAADSYATNEEAPLAIAAPGVLANDSDADAGTTLTAAVVTTTSNGVLALNANGSFTYTPNANVFGADSFTYRTNDGSLNSNIAAVSLTVNAVNDAPSFTEGPDQTAPSGNVAQTVPGWATAISAGPANESAQVIDFIVSNDNTAIFNVQPAISPAGTLTFTPKQNQTGTATVTVRAHDNGGTANGGLDTSAPRTFTITVTNAIQNFVVTNTNNSGNGSLRAAITNANANGSADVISFDIAGGGVRTITPLSPLPAIVFPVVINATTQPGYSGAPLIELNGSSAGVGANGLTIASDNVTIRGLAINRFQGSGLSLSGTNSLVAGNYIGTNAAGTAALPNGIDGIWIGAAPNTVGGSAPADRNVISGNARRGITVQNVGVAGTVIKGNYIGTNAAGGAAVANVEAGVWIEQSTRVQVGGAAAGDRNVISGNAGFGVHVTGSLPGAATLVQGNLIGLDVSGANALGNTGAGIKATNAAVEIGGTVPGARNVISAHPQGVAFSNSGSTFNSLIAGNYFGTDVTGMVARGNSTGVLIASAPGTRVGGDAPGNGNLFAGNSIGVTIDTISHPVIDGVYNAVVQGNVFGLNAAAGALSNGRGIAISNSDNLIGGTTAGAANVIANSTLTGVYVAPAGARNRITGNSIYDNGALGIDLGNDGLTPNDAGDGDAGANNLQNYPVLTVAYSNGAATTVAGTLNSTANTAFTIELFSNTAADPSGNGEGKLYIGSINVTTDSSGNVPFGTTLPNVAPGGFITATATDPAGNTSEFSPARLVVANTAPTATDDTATTVTGQSATLSPGSNDVDPDVVSPTVLAMVSNMGLGVPVLASPGDLAIVNSTGLGYFTGGNLAAAVLGKIGILDTNTNAIAGTIDLPVAGGSSLNRVNQTTGIVYLRGGALLAVDGRPASPTFNQVILSLSLGTISSMAIDETRGLMYVTSTTNAAGTVQQTRVSVIDVDPARAATFHQVIDQIAGPEGASFLSVAVNTVTNKIYVAQNTGPTAGVWVLDGVTRTFTTIGSLNFPVSLLVNDAENLVYAAAGTNLHVIDAATATRLTTVALPGSATVGQLDQRLALHKGLARVYVRVNEFPNPSRLFVIDGNRTSVTFNTVLAMLPLGREDNNTMVAVHGDTVVATSKSDLKTTVIDALTHAIVGTVASAQLTGRVSIDAAHNRAYITGGFSFLQSINLEDGTLHGQVLLGIEGNFPAINSNTHTAYVPRTGFSTNVALIDQTGLAGSIALPHGDGRAIIVSRNPVTNKFYVVNGQATAAGGSDALPGFVAVIDGSTNAVEAAVPVGPLPFLGMTINEVTNKIYVGGAADGPAFPGGIWVIDGATNTAVQANTSQIPANNAVPGQVSYIRDFAANTATNKVYFRITGGSPAAVGVLDGAANVATVLPTQPAGPNLIRVNPVLNRVYIGHQPAGQSNQVRVLDGVTDAEITTLTVGAPTNFLVTQSYLAVNRTTGRVFVADFTQHTLTVLDGATNAVVATIAVGRGPSAVAVNEAANRVYVGNALDKSLTIIDGGTLRVAATVSLPLTPTWLTVDETVSRVFATAAQHEPGMMVIADPGTSAPNVTSVTSGASGTTAINADGSVTYTPNAGFAGNDSFTYTVTDSNGGVSTATVNVTVSVPLTITSVLADTATVGSSYAHTLTASGGSAPYTWALASGQLPGGLSFNTQNGVITGTVKQAGSFTFTVRARDSAPLPQTATATYTIDVGPPVVTTTGLPAAFINTPYSQLLSVGGATGAVTWTIDKNNNPRLGWLSLSPDGTMSGTPNDPGQTPSFTVTATDSVNQAASRTLSLTVNAPLDVFPPREGVVLESQPGFSFIGGVGTRTITKTGGDPPPGLSLNSNGSFTGAPTHHGEYPFTVEIRDCEPNLTTGLPTCNNQTTPQIVSRNITMRVSAKEQQGSSGFGGSIAFGGSGGRRLAQVFTVGAHGTLTAIGLNNISCPAVTPVLVEVQRLTLAGLPDGITISDGVAVANYNAILITPALPVAIDERYAFIVSSPVSCTGFNNSSTSDAYNGGDAYAEPGGGWQPLFSTDARYDLPSFRTLIQPAMEVTYLNRGRGGLTQTLFGDGKVLLVGNNSAAEIYDPATRTSTLTSNLMALSRTNHTATLLDDGTVLIVGGRNRSTNLRTNVVEIFDPATGLFATAAAQLGIARDHHRAVRLNDGRVLIIGGFTDSFGRTATSEIYDPATQMFSPSGNMSTGREQFTATLLLSGKVLVTGGYTNGGGSHAEVFDPATGMFTATGNMVVSNRGQSTATLLADGKVLIAGGQSGDVRSEAEIYDPPGNSFAATGPMTSKRIAHTATLLADGSVLIAGGYDQQNNANYIFPLATLERYVPESGTFVAAGSMVTRRQSFAALRLPDDTVFLAGGFSQSWMTGNTGELYDPATALAITPTTLPDAQPNVEYPEVVLSASGGTPPYSIAHVTGVLPSGMTYNPATKTLSGTPTVSGVFPLGFEATDGDGNTVVQTLTLRVGNINTITSPYRLPDAALTASYSLQLTATGAPPTAWSVAPASSMMPPGLSLDGSGAITGTPTATGYYNFTVRAVDNNGQAAVKVLSINVLLPLTITTTSLADATAGQTYGGCLFASGGAGNRTWSLSGDIPTGLAMQPSNGCFDGTWPARTLRQGGTFTFTVHVTDSSVPPQSDEQEFTIRIHAQDQQPGADFSQPPIPLPATRRIAQVFRASSPFPLSGLQLFNYVTCSTATQFVVDVRPVTGSPARPDESGAPLGSVTMTTSANGFFNSMLAFPQPIEIPQGSLFAVVVSFADQCSGGGWPATDWYRTGDAWIDDGAGWTLASAEIGRYDIPFTTLVMPPSDLRFFSGWNGGAASATLIDGRLLIVGTEQWAEVYDADANTLVNSANNMASRRQQATATTLSDGKVLIVGGVYWDDNQQIAANTTSIFDPVTNTFSAGPVMPVGRWGHRATRLSSGKVLITGGWTRDGNNQITLDSALLFAEDGMSFVPLTMTGARVKHSATLISGDRVLIVGGWTGPPWPSTVAEIYDPTVGPDGTFTAVPGGYNKWPAQHTATLITAGVRAGQVLIAGGAVGNYPNLDAAGTFFDPVTLTFSAGPDLLVPRFEHTATTLNDGKIVFAGGVSDWFNYQSTTVVEMYDPVSDQATLVGDLITDRNEHTAAIVTGVSGTALAVAGGWSSASLAPKTIELVDLTAAALTITTTTLPDGMSGQNYVTPPIGAAGGSGGYTFTLAFGALPPGLELAADGALSGEPSTGGIYNFVVQVADSSNVATRSLTIVVNRLVIASASPLPSVVTNGNYSHQLTVTGGVGTVTWSIDCCSQPPAGITLDADGLLSGSAPPIPSYYFFTVRATDSAGQVAIKNLTLQVVTPLMITTTTLGDGTAGETYSGCMGWNGGNGSFTWSLSGQYPIGLSIQNNGCFDNNYPASILRQGGTYNFTVHVSDSSFPPQSDTQDFTIRVHAQDQNPGWGFGDAHIPMPATRRIAQVYRSSSAVPLSGLQVFNNLTCDPGVQVTAAVWPVTGSPAIPNEAGLPLGSATATTNAFGWFNSMLVFTDPIAMPQGALFAVTLDADGACTVKNWPVDPYYRGGDAWVDDNGNWTLARTAVGREDLPFSTLVLPASGLRFFSSWRGGQATATLADGRLLVVGPDFTAEIYDPATNTLTNTGNMSTGRHGATATLLTDGKVLIAGGQTWNGNQNVANNTTEIFNPVTGMFSPGPVMSDGRYNHAATTLADGRVLITGGTNIVTIEGNTFWLSVASAVLFDGTGAIEAELAMTGARAEHSATLLDDGRVLILGGWTSDPWPATVAEIFNPGANTFTGVVAGLPMWPSQHTATLLTTGKVLIAGGPGNYPALSSDSFLFDPMLESFTNGPGLAVPRMQHTATPLADGRVVFTGGIADWQYNVSTPVVEFYDPLENQFTAGGDLMTDRYGHAADLVTVAGQPTLAVSAGWGSGALASKTIELFDLTAAQTALVITTQMLPDGTTGEEYSPVIMAAGGDTDYSFSLTWGELPPGVSLGAVGGMSGTPLTPGISTFTVKVTDSSAATAYRSFTIVVDRLTITSPATLPEAVTGVAYNYQFTRSGGAGPFTWSSSSLPGGLSLTPAGLLSGTLNTPGWVGGTITVADAFGQTALKNFNILVMAPLTLAAGTPFLGVATEFYHYEVQPQNGISPLTWSIDSGLLLPGLQLDQFGSINGFPTRTGLFDVTIRATDSGAPRKRRRAPCWSASPQSINVRRAGCWATRCRSTRRRR